MFGKLRKRSLHLRVGQTAAVRNIDGREVFLRDHVKIEMKHELAGVGVNLSQSRLCGSRRTFRLDIDGIDMSYRRPS